MRRTFYSRLLLADILSYYEYICATLEVYRRWIGFVEVCKTQLSSELSTWRVPMKHTYTLFVEVVDRWLVRHWKGLANKQQCFFFFFPSFFSLFLLPPFFVMQLSIGNALVFQNANGIIDHPSGSTNIIFAPGRIDMLF
jgi:hypothetical protein